ncbi:hypothetical protein NC652_010613 [Populus alba x Populus x berolinensis]|nr:hypothetical protein NC652_010613 [Populus alba x Populus x berolinensis]
MANLRCLLCLVLVLLLLSRVNSRAFNLRVKRRNVSQMFKAFHKFASASNQTRYKRPDR